MKRFLVLMGATAMILVFLSADSSARADSFGVHFAGPGYHVDIGRAHHGRNYRVADHGHRHAYPHRARKGWHDTSHYHYHPGEFVRHRDHYHYVPGHYHIHNSGHWHHRRGW